MLCKQILFNPLILSVWYSRKSIPCLGCQLVHHSASRSTFEYSSEFGCDMEEAIDLIDLAKTLKCSLETDFGTPFSIWSEDFGWQRLTQDKLSPQETTESEAIEEVLNQLPIVPSSQTVAFADGQQILALPVNGTKGQRIVVVGIIGPHDPKIVKALADRTLKATEQNAKLVDASNQLTQSLEQITSDFEELSWFRSLSYHFGACDIRLHVTQVCDRIVPSLRRLIGASSIHVISMPPPSTCPSNQTKECLQLHCDGDSKIPFERIRELMGTVLGNPNEQTVVWNSQNYFRAVNSEMEIRNYILMPVPIAKSNTLWLVALNKNGPAELLLEENERELDRNLFEFGTVEAGLLQAMVVLLGTHARNNELYRENEALLVGVIRSLVNTIDAKDAYTSGHSDRVAVMSKRIAQEMGFSEFECEQVHMAGLLHDIGKIGVPDHVLGKPDKLSGEEFDLMKKHPTIGFEILKHLKPLEYALPGVLYHHETLDGKGYPFGLVGEQIPVLGRIIAVADSYDAMTSDRVYRKGLTAAKAESILRDNAGTQWDSRVVGSFFAALPDIHTICGLTPSATAAQAIPSNAYVSCT